MKHASSARTRQRRHTCFISCTACAALLCLAQVVVAQRANPLPANTYNNSPNAAGKSFPASITPIEFSDEPLRLDAVGLTMQIPMGSRAQSSTVGSDVSASILGESSSWLINVRTPRLAGDVKLTSREVLEQIAEHIASASGEVFIARETDGRFKSKPFAARFNDVAGSYAKLLGEPETIIINGMQAERVYIELPPIRQFPATVRGLTVFKSGAVQFVVADLTVILSDFSSVKPIYETTLATTTIINDAQLTNRRAAAVKLGQALIAGLKPNDYEAALTAKPERWLRRYRPAANGSIRDAQELGYARIRTAKGTRNAVATSPGPTGNQEGYVIRVDYRMLDGTDGVVDSRGTYFTTPERDDEVWQVENSIKRGGNSIVIIERGGRNGKSMTVSIEGQGRAPMTIKPILQGDGYITIVEDLLLPRFLVVSGLQGELGFYAYRSDTGTIRYRRDTISIDPQNSNVVLLATTRGDDAKSQTSRYSKSGDFIQTLLPDNSIWEPTTPEALMRIWKDKGLPLD